jgi:hypothetical protein
MLNLEQNVQNAAMVVQRSVGSAHAVPKQKKQTKAAKYFAALERKQAENSVAKRPFQTSRGSGTSA